MAILFGKPGITEQNPTDDVMAMKLTEQKVFGKKELDEVITQLKLYKQGKQNLEQRIIEDEQWYKLRHWDVLNKKINTDKHSPQPSSAWLFNAISNKHADAMDNYPEPIVLPRERTDEDSAKSLSSILPVVMEYNDFEQTYSDNWWEKLKHGTGVYGVFWDTTKENGLGDVDVHDLDILNLFWEPGITDVQKSKYFFIADLQDNDLIKQAYPEMDGKIGGDIVDIAHYLYDDQVDTTNKSAIMDCYYKVRSADGRNILHYVKFVGNTILYATENDPLRRFTGLYDHGMYPVVFDTLYPEKGTPVGFGMVSICKEPQIYIDKLSGFVMENAMMTTKKRFFISESTNINEEEFLDWTKPLVHCATEVTDNKLKEIVCQPLDDTVLTVIQMKEEEMKDTASNRDVNSGGTGSGVTAAAAIAALQEAGNKTSRDMISASYRAFSAIESMVIELIRQFYDEARAFRITGQMPGQFDFTYMDNSGLKDQPMMGADGMPIMIGNAPALRKPIFDLKIKAQKKNPFSRMEQNERAKELYSLGFFNPERAQEALPCLDMMEFEGIDKIKEQIAQGATLLNLCQQLSAENAILKASMGIQPNMGGAMQGNANTQPMQKSSSNGITESVMQAQTPMTSYGQKLAERSKPDMNANNAGVNVK